MGLIRNPDALRLNPDDPVPSFLGNKVIPGEGIAITRKVDKQFGQQAIFSCINDAMGSRGEVVYLNETGVVPRNASLVLVDASISQIQVKLPHPAEVLNWIAVVCLDNSNGVSFHCAVEGEPIGASEEGRVIDCNTKIFNNDLEFHAAGDSFIFASNRSDTWFCIARFASNWYV